MAKNRIVQVEQLKKEMRKGWPNGAGDVYKEIPLLLARIEELEIALVPFANAGVSNYQHIAPDRQVNVYMGDCLRALDVMDSGQAFVPAVEDFGLPAE